jgi:hypothetical protein
MQEWLGRNLVLHQRQLSQRSRIQLELDRALRVVDIKRRTQIHKLLGRSNFNEASRLWRCRRTGLDGLGCCWHWSRQTSIIAPFLSKS